MRFQYIKEHKDELNIKRACKTLNVSYSGYYAHLHRKPSNRSIEDEILAEKIKVIFDNHKSRYGSIRIRKVLQNQEILISRKRVVKLMRKLGLTVKGTRYNCRKLGGAKTGEANPNLLNQCFQATAINRVWLSDITYIPTQKGFVYLCVFLDVFSRKITGWSMSTKMTDDLSSGAFMQAYNREHPAEGLIVHTDQGAQFTSNNFRLVLHQHGVQLSNSRRGNPYDNAMMESFYRTIKRELIDDISFETHEQAQMAVFKYIECYYNSLRMHTSLGFLSPIQYEKEFLQNQLNLVSKKG